MDGCTCQDKPQWCDYCIRRIEAQAKLVPQEPEDARLRRVYGLVSIDGLIGEWSPTRFEPTAKQQEPDGLVECQFCDNKIAPSHLVCVECFAAGCRSYTIPPHRPLPETAQAIMDLDRKPLTDKQQREGDGIARAVQNLNVHENRLGASRYQP